MIQEPTLRGFAAASQAGANALAKNALAVQQQSMETWMSSLQPAK